MPLLAVPADVPAECAVYTEAAWNGGALVGFVLGALVLLAAALLVGYWLWPRSVRIVWAGPVEYTETLHPQAHAPAIRLSRPVSRAAASTTPHLLVPAVYSHEDEGYVIRVRMGADNVLVVLDSGSANLSVGTAECVKDRLCSAHDGAYRPAASPHAVNLQKPANLEYASLTVQAHWWRDQMGLPVVTQCGEPPPLEHAHDEVALQDLIPVAAARRMDGTVSNVLGLMSAHDGQADTPVLELMLAALGLPRRWGLAAYPSGKGWFVLGAFPAKCFPRAQLKHVPMSTTFTYMGAPCVDVEAMRYRPSGMTQWRAVPDAPRHVLLDTGTAQSYLTSRYAHMCQRIGLPAAGARVTALDGLPDLEITLKGGVTVVYTPSHYMRKSGDGGYATTLHCGNDAVDAMFGPQGAAVLLGIHHLTGLYMDVDFDAQRVGFAKID